MDSGVRRQLPSWMIRTTATESEKTSTSETKVENKENGSVEPHIKVVKPRKKAQTKINDIGTPLVDSKLQTLENCKAKTTKRKLKSHEKSQGDRYQEDESHPLKPCKESRKKRMLDKHCEDRVEDALESDKHKKVKGLVRKRVVEEAVKKKQSKNLKNFHKETTEYNSSEDELTVEDLVSIAKELVEANRNEFQKSKDLEFKTKTESAHRADCQVSSENQLTSYRESDSVTDRPLASDSSLSKRESTEGSNINLNTTDDGGSLSMIDLLMGHLLKKSEEVERKTDAINDKFMLDYELSKANQIENLSEVVPVSKKSNFKDKVRELLD